MTVLLTSVSTCPLLVPRGPPTDSHPSSLSQLAVRHVQITRCDSCLDLTMRCLPDSDFITLSWVSPLLPLSLRPLRPSC